MPEPRGLATRFIKWFCLTLSCQLLADLYRFIFLEENLIKGTNFANYHACKIYFSCFAYKRAGEVVFPE